MFIKKSNKHEVNLALIGSFYVRKKENSIFMNENVSPVCCIVLLLHAEF